MRDAGGQIFHFVLKDDPAYDASAAYDMPPLEEVVTTDGKRVRTWDISNQIQLKPGTPANPTKDTPAFMELTDEGSLEFLEVSQTFKKAVFHGKVLKGAYVLARESASTEFWEFQRSAGPQLSKRAEYPVYLVKADKVRHWVFGIVMEPLERDTQGHFITESEITDALEFYALNSMLYDYEHQFVLPPKDAVPVMLFQAPADMEWPVGDSFYAIRKGSWVQVTKVLNPKLWTLIEKGEVNAYSIRGWGRVGDERPIPKEFA